jgi:preprotein translocase subunit Sss1
MLKINRCLLGLALVGGIVSLTASPVRAESKISQCKRFSQTMSTFSQKMIPVLKSAKKGDRDEFISSLDQILRVSNKELKRIQARQFTDPKLQSLQNQALSLYTEFHNGFVQIANAADQNDRPAAENGLKAIKSLVPQEAKLGKQFNQYCGGK